ncbi:mechanosensitive ion channel family protein [Rubrobacter indicoceani]|uniref:mechanosensitive ion channel family protein n=1 Tax=Rubrobacter indicoceani TaxID=2051957 RepID=UPI000E5BF959|nr:mechanosensitive ion channel domain-containing protein [Rubrobacter indicoceani]
MGELLSTLIQYVPRVLGALAIVVVGLLIAVLARRGATFMLRRFNFDELCRRVGITRLLGEDSRRTPTGFVGQIVFYGVVVFAVLAALGPLGLDFLASTLNQVVLYAPKVVAAILILILGTSAAGLVSEMLGRWLTGAGVGSANGIKSFVRFAMIFLVAILAASVLEIDVTILIVVTIIGLGGVALTAALAIGLGLRGLSSNIAAGRYISEGIEEGDEIRIGELSGVVEEVGHAMTKLRDDNGRLHLVPNSHFLENVVEKAEATP